MIPFELSPLVHTWFFDLDGTILKHNGYFEQGYDELLPGVREIWETIPMDDVIVITTARRPMYQESTAKFLLENHIRYDHLLFGIGHGERIVVNDEKPEFNNLQTAYGWCVKRDVGFY